MDNNMISGEQRDYRTGMLCAVGSFIMWGFLPVYWKALIPINSYVIILYRILLVGVFCFITGCVCYGLKGILEPLRDKKKVLILFFAGLLISVNWSIYIYAVNSGQAIETTIGYYINPLVICIFGMVLFREKPNRYKLTSIALAGCGVMVILLYFMRIPLIALSLALSFGIYAAIKKHMKMPAIITLFYETVFIVPIALAFIIYAEINGNGAFTAGAPYQLVLLLFAGVFTATPLVTFAAAANRVSLISIGICQYIAPSITLVISIFLFKEPFDKVQLLAFMIIWIGLAFFTYGEIRSGLKKGLNSK